MLDVLLISAFLLCNTFRDVAELYEQTRERRWFRVAIITNGEESAYVNASFLKQTFDFFSSENESKHEVKY